ncbi:2214_t:CDS:1 [Dentiscutata erythropus]|uniref:2214_t:CDS:1 n=1 Tax=Dentiscutata erythropus TaxID=1348616 RepID=A0A9N8W683_9GLOM|nr:2214_t:CDS:1 [Dentiscutata erythropus]
MSLLFTRFSRSTSHIFRTDSFSIPIWPQKRTKSNTSTNKSVSPVQDLLKNQNKWRKQIQIERRQELKKLEETEKILSLSSEQKFITPGYRQQKREAGIQNYKRFQSMKRQEGLSHLLSLYHDSSNFVTLNNLDAKIDEAFTNPHPRNVYAHALEDMQIEYQEASGGVNENEILRRLGQIKDILDGTSHSGIHLGLDMIDPPTEPVEEQKEHEQPKKSSVD